MIEEYRAQKYSNGELLVQELESEIRVPLTLTVQVECDQH